MLDFWLLYGARSYSQNTYVKLENEKSRIKAMLYLLSFAEN